MAQVKPSDLEMQVLSVLWAKGPLGAKEVLEQLPDGKKRSYTTVLSVMQVMEKKGLLTHTQARRAYVYKPAVSRRKVLGPMLRTLVRNLFGGDATAAVQHLIEETDLSASELKQLRELLKEQRGKKDE